jgi:hypothetical protein
LTKVPYNNVKFQEQQQQQRLAIAGRRQQQQQQCSKAIPRTNSLLPFLMSLSDFSH